MTNFFNDLNKLVNTIDKVDRMLTEKPKRPRVKYITKRFTEDEIDFLLDQLNRVSDFDNSIEEEKLLKILKNKLGKIK